MEKFHIIDLVACADRIPERAQALAEKYSLKVMTNEEIYQDPEIEIVVNLTCPESHYEVSKAAILAGKNVYCEKMMAVTLEEGKELYALAKEKRGTVYHCSGYFPGRQLANGQKGVGRRF